MQKSLLLSIVGLLAFAIVCNVSMSRAQQALASTTPRPDQVGRYRLAIMQQPAEWVYVIDSATGAVWHRSPMDQAWISDGNPSVGAVHEKP